jgi:hypothetical protein
LKLRSTILDGEIVAIDDQGIPRFQLLQKWQKQASAPLAYYLFDVLWTGPIVLTASINGQISPITINGSFSVNPDGSVFEIEQQTGGPNALLHFTDYPTPDGNTITFVETDPGSILSGIDTR